jgi:signal transduction histidine kinase
MSRRRDQMSLRSRLVWSVSYILLAVIVALAIPLAIRLSRRGTQELASDTLITAQTMGAYIGGENIDRPNALARIAAAAPPEIDRVVVTDINGIAVYDSAGTSVGENFANGLRPEIDAALAGDPVAEVRYSNTLGHDNMYAAAPIIDERIVGTIRLTRNAQEVSDAARRTWIGLSLVGAAGLLAGIVLAFGLASSLSRPLQQLAEAAHDLGEGDLAVRVGDIGGSREVYEVAGSFDEMAERLERTVSAQREFVANASHQLRTPLTGMKLRIESAMDGTDDAELQRQLGAAEGEVDRLSLIVDRLLVMARHIEEGAATRVELGEAATEAVARWDERAQRLDSALSVNGAGGSAHADPTDVDQILDNLLDNATSYAPGPIDVSYGATNGRVWLCVRDHGPGIPAAERARVTERFYRGKSAPAGGSGLGLAIARELAEKWGGTLDVDDGEGGGTAISASFPEARS